MLLLLLLLFLGIFFIFYRIYQLCRENLAKSRINFYPFIWTIFCVLLLRNIIITNQFLLAHHIQLCTQELVNTIYHSRYVKWINGTVKDETNGCIKDFLSFINKFTFFVALLRPGFSHETEIRPCPNWLNNRVGDALWLKKDISAKTSPKTQQNFIFHVDITTASLITLDI